MAQNTSNHSWSIPTVNDDKDAWGTIINSLLEDNLDVEVPLFNEQASRPATPDTNAWNIDYQNKRVSFFDGSTWHNIAGLDTNGDDITDQTTTIWDSTNGYVPSAQVQGLDTHTGSTSNPHSVTAAQVGAITGDPVSIKVGTLGTRPAAGTTNRWYFTSDNNGIYYDDGAAWQLIAEHPNNISAGDVGAVPATGGTFSGNVNVNATLSENSDGVTTSPDANVKEFYVSATAPTTSNPYVRFEP